VNILALDTSTEACSAALLRADGELFGEFEVAPRQHTRLLPKMIDAVMVHAGLARRELSHCAFANGPGAFTGIRIAAAQAQGIAIALDLPLLPVSTLAVLAQTRFEQAPGNTALVALDARMGELYWAIYQRDAGGGLRLRGREQLSAASDVVIDADVDSGAGHGWLLLPPQQGMDIASDCLPDAAALARLGQREARAGRALPAASIEINYLRNRVAEKAARR